MGACLDRLAQAIDELRATPAETLTDAELDELVVGIHRAIARLTAAAAPLACRWLDRGVWADDGSRTAAGRLGRSLHCATTTAANVLRQARHLERMPVVADAVTDGRLHTDHIALLARADGHDRHTQFTAHEADLIATIEPLRYPDAARTVAYWIHHADATNHPDGTGELVERSELYASRTLDGRLALSGNLDTISAEIITGELGRLTEQLRLEDQRGGCTRTPAQRRAAALVEMARRSATQAAGRRPAPLFTVLVGEATFQRVCELASGTVVTPGELVPHLTSAQFERIIFDGPSRVIDVSGRRRFTGAVRRAIQVRDRRCTHPSGCDEPASGCDIDHVAPRSRGGPTSQHNGTLRCPTHNRVRPSPVTPDVSFEIHPLDDQTNLQVARLRFWLVRHLSGAAPDRAAA